VLVIVLVKKTKLVHRIVNKLLLVKVPELVKPIAENYLIKNLEVVPVPVLPLPDPLPIVRVIKIPQLVLLVANGLIPNVVVIAESPKVVPVLPNPLNLPVLV
jgi:hypothetical protein